MKKRVRNIYPIGGKDNNKKGFRLNFGDHYKHLKASYDKDTLELSKYKNNSRTETKYLVFEADVNRFATKENVKQLNNEYTKEKEHQVGTSHRKTFDKLQNEISLHTKTKIKLSAEKTAHAKTIENLDAERRGDLFTAHWRSKLDRDKYKVPIFISRASTPNWPIEIDSNKPLEEYTFKGQKVDLNKVYTRFNAERFVTVNCSAPKHSDRHLLIKVYNGALQNATLKIGQLATTVSYLSLNCPGKQYTMVHFYLPRDTQFYFFMKGPKGAHYHHDHITVNTRIYRPKEN